VLLSDLESGYRFDSELYQKQYVILNKFAETHECTTFSKEAAVVSKGIFNINSSCYSEEGIPFVRISNIDKMLVSMDEIVCIPTKEHIKHSKTKLTKGDIILSKTGGPAAAFVDLLECNVSQDTVAVKLKSNSKIKPEYTVVYLNCVYGLTQMRKRFTGNVQMHLNLDDCKNNVIIPVMAPLFQKRVSELFHEALKLQKKSTEAFSMCNKLLVEALGFSEKDIVGLNTTEKSFLNSFEKSKRLDAEFYLPKYDILYSLIKKFNKNVKTIRSLATFNSRGKQPVYSNTGMLQVINSKHILENSLDYNNFEKTNSDVWDSSPTARVFNGDILTYTTGANIGRTAIYLGSEKAIASNHVNILRTKEKHPIYIAVVLNSFIGRLQTEKLCGGSAQQELYPSQIGEFIIPFVEEKYQISISNSYVEAVQYKEKSRKLFDALVHSVELAIEKNEEMALEWLDSIVSCLEV